MPNRDAPIVLESERLLFREITDEDHAGLYELYLNPRVNRFVGGPPLPFEEYLAASRARWNRHYDEYGFGMWAVLRKEDGRLLGRCGLVVQEVDGAREVEVGYVFGEEFWRRGYATEAARACRDRAFETLVVPRVISLINAANEPSIRVAERNGMTLWKTTDWKGYEGIRVYRVTRREWERLRGGESRP